MLGNLTGFPVVVALLILSNHMEVAEYDGRCEVPPKVCITLLFGHVETNSSSVTVGVYIQAFCLDSPK